MKIHNFIQGSEAWLAARRGRPTASRFSDILTAAKAEYSKSAPRYMHQLIAECFATDVQEFTGTKWTDRGTELEPEAREAFIAHTGLPVVQVGFITRDDGVVGCSPDGLITTADGMDYVAGLEIKCLTPSAHVAIVAGCAMPDDYKAQVHGGMAVTGLKSWHFWSYCPGMRPFHIVVRRDDYTEKLSATLDRFLIEYAALRARLIPQLALTLPE